MKILLTTDWYLPAVNGVVTSVLNLRRQLLAQGHEVRVLTLAGGPHTVEQEGVIALGSVDAGRVYPGARLRSTLAGREVRALIAWQPEIVHSQCEFSTFFLAKRIARACGAPLLHTYHTVYEDYTHYFSPNRRWGRWLVRGLSRWVLRGADRVVAPTEKVRQILAGYGINRPVAVIPTGIDLGRFRARPEQRWLERQRSRLGIPPENRVLLYVGRLAQEKNVEELLECRACMARGCGLPVTLLLVGGGPWQAELEARAGALGLLREKAVVFAGMVPPQEVAGYYHLGDLFLSASTSETQGLTYVEALAAGLPALCRADPCLDGVVRDGVNGWQYHSVQECAARAEELLNDPERLRAMAQSAAASAKAFSNVRFAARMLEEYGAALAGRKNGQGGAFGAGLPHPGGGGEMGARRAVFGSCKKFIQYHRI